MISSSNANFDETGFASLVRDMERAYLLLSELGVEGGDSNVSTVLRFDGGGMLPSASQVLGPAYDNPIGSGTTGGTLTSNIAAGTYTNPTITIDRYGKISSISNGTATAGGLANLPDPIVNVNGYKSIYTNGSYTWTNYAKYNSIKMELSGSNQIYSELTLAKLELVANTANSTYSSILQSGGIYLSSTSVNGSVLNIGFTIDANNSASIQYADSYMHSSRAFVINNRIAGKDNSITLGSGHISMIKRFGTDVVQTDVCDLANITSDGSVPTIYGTRGQLICIV